MLKFYRFCRARKTPRCFWNCIFIIIHIYFVRFLYCATLEFFFTNVKVCSLRLFNLIHREGAYFPHASVNLWQCCWNMLLLYLDELFWIYGISVAICVLILGCKRFLPYRCRACSVLRRESFLLKASLYLLFPPWWKSSSAREDSPIDARVLSFRE